MGNPIQIQLVEIVRGEEQGCVRLAEIVSADGGPRVYIRLVKTLPDGFVSFFAPPELVESRVKIEVEGDGGIPALRTNDRIVLHVPVHSYLRFLPSLYRANSSTIRRDVHQVSEREQRQLAIRNQVTTSRVNVDEADRFNDFYFCFSTS